MHTMIGLLLAAWMGVAYAATPKQAVLRVENMTCPTCRVTIEKALAKVPGTSKPHIDTRAATVTVIFDAERTSVAAIAEAIAEAGFPAKPSADGD